MKRYQTVWAAKPGAVAAPTASLHFDEGVLAALKARGIHSAEVTLHVGAGTFQPVRTENLADHKMHSEWFDVPETTADAIRATRAAGGRIVSVGTTTLRAVASTASSDFSGGEGVKIHDRAKGIRKLTRSQQQEKEQQEEEKV